MKFILRGRYRWRRMKFFEIVERFAIKFKEDEKQKRKNVDQRKFKEVEKQNQKKVDQRKKGGSPD